MNKLGIFLGGLVSGSAATAAAGYFFVYKKYIPLRELEHSIADLQEEKRELCRKVGDINKALDELSESKKEFEKRIKSEKKPEAHKAIDDEKPSKDPSRDSAVPERISYDVQKYKGGTDIPEQPETTIPEELFEDDETDDGAVPTIIDDDCPRIDGQLTAKEQKEIDDCGEDDALAHTILTRIKEDRFNASIDPNRTSYLIDRATFENHLDFFEQPVYLVYYQPDGLVALRDGNELIEMPDALVSTTCFEQLEDENSDMTFENDDGEKTVVCRNDNMLTDYVVSRIDETYVEAMKEQEGQ